MKNQLFEKVFLRKDPKPTGPYACFIHTRTLLRSAAERCSVAEVMAAMGYVKRDKFKRHLAEWVNLSRTKVPLKLISALGLSVDDLEISLALDRDSYEHACNQPRKILNVIERIMSCVVTNLVPPAELIDPDDVIEWVQRRSEKEPFRYIITFDPPVTTVFIEKGKVITAHSVPTIRLENGILTFSPEPTAGWRPYTLRI